MKKHLISALFAASITLFSAHGAANAHMWYDKDCCDTNDCSIVSHVDIDETGFTFYGDQFGVAKLTPEEWKLRLDQKRLRPSKDGRWHICAYPYLSGGKTAYKVRCVYIPSGS